MTIEDFVVGGDVFAFYESQAFGQQGMRICFWPVGERGTFGLPSPEALAERLCERVVRDAHIQSDKYLVFGGQMGPEPIAFLNKALQLFVTSIRSYPLCGGICLLEDNEHSQFVVHTLMEGHAIEMDEAIVLSANVYDRLGLQITLDSFDSAGF